MKLYKIKKHDIEEFTKEEVLAILKISEKEFDDVLVKFTGKDCVRFSTFDDVYVAYHSYFLKRSTAIERLCESLKLDIDTCLEKARLIGNIYDGFQEELRKLS